MPGKTRRERRKHSAQGKRRIDGASRQPVFAQQPAVAQIEESVSPPNMPLPSAGVPTPMAKPEAVRYPYIATELLTIGILAVIMLVILIVLALVPLPW
ncbi:hypothetical protein ACFLT4_02055 [Chloroflexota bacterium]